MTEQNEPQTLADWYRLHGPVPPQTSSDLMMQSPVWISRVNVILRSATVEPSTLSGYFRIQASDGCYYLREPFEIYLTQEAAVRAKGGRVMNTTCPITCLEKANTRIAELEAKLAKHMLDEHDFEELWREYALADPATLDSHAQELRKHLRQIVGIDEAERRARVAENKVESVLSMARAFTDPANLMDTLVDSTVEQVGRWILNAIAEAEEGDNEVR